jgi:alpha 1,2-mannosyltransferase
MFNFLNLKWIPLIKFVYLKTKPNHTVINFSEHGLREVSMSFSNGFIEKIRYSWKSFVFSIQDYPNTFEGKGIVVCAGGVKYITCAWVLISMLRHQNCKLPIEVWYAGNEVSQEMMTELAKFPATAT